MTVAHSAAMVVYRSEGLSEHIHIALHTTLYYIRTPRKTFHLCERCHACERISGSARVVGVVSLTAGRVSMRRVLVEPAVLGPPSTYFNTCEVDDALEDAESLTLVNERFPGFCPFHIVHNLLGGHYSRSPHCTTAPFSDTMCEHGSHSRPSDAVDQRTHCPAMGAVVFLPLGLSYRAGFPGSLVVGCVECQYFSYGMACATCGRRWDGDRPDVADDYAMWNSLHHHMPDCGCGACPPEEQESGGGGSDEEDWEDEEEWENEEEWEDEEEEYGGEDWYGEVEEDGEAEGGGEAEWGSQEEEEAEPGEEAGAEEPAGWGSGTLGAHSAGLCVGGRLPLA